MKVSHGLSVLYWIRKNAGSEDKSPLYCRITINGQRSNYAMGIEVKEKDFNKATGFLKSRTEDAAIINESLIENTSKVRKIFNDLKEKHDHITPAMICNVLHGKVEKQKTLLDAFEFHNKQFLEKVQAGKKAIGTYRRFQVTINKVRQFLKKQYKLPDLALSAIRNSFAADFEHHLTTVDKIGNNTAMKYIRNTRKVLWMCVQKEWILQNPIQQFRCTYTAPQREVLIEDELFILATTPIKSKRLNEARDCYLAMCYTGYAYKDASQLSNDNIQIMIDGSKWLIKNRIKTECKENVPILPIVAELIEKYKDHPYCVKHNKLFPILSNQKFNVYIKEVAAICNIDKNLTTHIARHTFATTVTLSNGVPIETVSALLGHSSIKTTQIYAKVVAQKVSNDMQALKQTLAAKIDAKKEKEKKLQAVS